MQHSLLKNLLSSSFYNTQKDKLKHNLFADEAKDLFDIITAAHKKYGHDLSTKEVMALFDIQFPIATQAEKGAMQDLVGERKPAHHAGLHHGLWSVFPTARVADPDGQGRAGQRRGTG